MFKLKIGEDILMIKSTANTVNYKKKPYI